MLLGAGFAYYCFLSFEFPRTAFNVNQLSSSLSVVSPLLSSLDLTDLGISPSNQLLLIKVLFIFKIEMEGAFLI